MFELSWGQGQQLTAKVPYLPTLTTLYQNWQQAYLNFYQSAIRARVGKSGTLPKPEIDWRAKLVQAEAKWLAEFHLWLSQAELLEIRREIARAAQNADAAAVDVFLTCDSVELERLPWEVWEPGTEFAAKKTIRIARTPASIRADLRQRQRQGKMRVLAILGDDTGLNFQADQEAVKSLAHLAEIHFVGWQQGDDTTDLKETIRRTIADEQGWDILFFAGHSNEAALTGGELAIAPNESIFLNEIATQLVLAKERGLQFAIFNSCRGLSLAQTLIDLGLSQVAVMREPIHNRVAQEFLVRFVQSLSEFKDGHDALLDACKYLKLEKNLTYPSAYLIPSLFRHPDSAPFQLKPFGWKEKLKQWLPSKQEAIALGTITLLSLLPSVQNLLLEPRIWMQANYRAVTGRLAPATPPVLLVQIDQDSIRELDARKVFPIDRRYLAKLLERIQALHPSVIGIDYVLDNPTEEDIQLNQAIQSAVQQGTWFVFGSKMTSANRELGAASSITNLHWSLQGYINAFPWYVELPSISSQCIDTCPFAYLLALAQTAHRFSLDSSLPQPRLQSQEDLRTQLMRSIQPSQNAKITKLWHARLLPLTMASQNWGQLWLQPILDFSIPPDRVYQVVSAQQILKGSVQFATPSSPIVLIAPGGYDRAGVTGQGEDNFPVPMAVAFWRNRAVGNLQSAPIFTGAEAHAYMVHHLLNQRLVIPIPDLWLILIAAILGKAIVVFQLMPKSKQVWIGLGLGTFIYPLFALELYQAAAVLLPWFLPLVIFWVYLLPVFRRNMNG